ncbi:TPA: GNAT family N-acetyltransferase [Legionella pneumophila]|nr:GNAT family N-acetyltransferase [Legionella pneumophila]HDV5695174.1 GNAT family N-acetyltransferase [Legionella pneumophila]HDV5796881.1 GNAT family N-acetyltransferase [Legionella pneumophila]
MQNTTISTQRLNLRRLQEDDLGYLLELNQDPDVRKFFPDGLLNREQTNLGMQLTNLTTTYSV